MVVAVAAPRILKFPVPDIKALNEGLKLIRYPWVIRADADDFNLPHRFSTLANLIDEKPDLGLIGSAISEVDKFRNHLAVRRVPLLETDIRQFVKTRSPFNHMAVAYRLEYVLACGGYPNIYLKEDYALWCLMLARNIPVANVDDVLVHASAGSGMYKRRGGWRYAKSEWKIQNTLIKCGLKGYFSAFIDGVLRGVLFLVPTWLRGWVYVNFLRK
jgi:hypothetical protein